MCREGRAPGDALCGSNLQSVTLASSGNPPLGEGEGSALRPARSFGAGCIRAGCRHVMPPASPLPADGYSKHGNPVVTICIQLHRHPACASFSPPGVSERSGNNHKRLLTLQAVRSVKRKGNHRDIRQRRTDH